MRNDVTQCAAELPSTAPPRVANSAAMPAFVERYSAEMRAALFRATIDDKRSVAAALRAAQAGELDDLGAEDQATLGTMAPGYAGQLVRDEKQRRGVIVKVRGNVEEAAHDVAARLAALAAREVGQLEAVKAKTPVDTGRGLRAAKMMREALALARDAEQKTAAPTKPTAGDAKAAPAHTSFLGRLAGRSDAEQDDAPPSPSDSAASHTAPAQPTAQQQDTSSSGPVRLRVSDAPVSEGAAVSAARGR